MHDELCSDKELFPWLSIHQAKFMTRHTMQVNNLKSRTDATVGEWLAEMSEFFAALDKFHDYQIPLMEKALDALDKVGKANNSTRGVSDEQSV
jgi:hypothetical protein